MFCSISHSVGRSFASYIRQYSKSIVLQSKLGAFVGYEPYQMEMLQKEFLSSIIII